MSAGSSIIAVVPTLLALGVIAVVIKNFNVNGRSRKFELSSTHETKPAAQREAQDLKDDGFLTKTTMKIEGGKKTFNVWKHSKGASKAKDKVFDL